MSPANNQGFAIEAHGLVYTKLVPAFPEWDIKDIPLPMYYSGISCIQFCNEKLWHLTVLIYRLGLAAGIKSGMSGCC